MSELTVVNNEQTMSSREIAELTGKSHRNVTRDISVMCYDLEIDCSDLSSDYVAGNGQVYKEFNLNRELTDCLLTGYSAKLRMAVIRRWHELENAKTPRLPTNYVEALQALIESEKQKQLAIDTKAEIGNRREATAMNTASTATKRVNKLEVELDQSKMWSTIKRMEMMTDIKFNWRLLKSAGADLGIQSIDVFDPNFGSVKAYHRDVWLEAYQIEISQ